MFPPMEMAGLTDAEERVCQAFSRREEVDFRRPDDPGAENGHQWAAERAIRAEVLRNLLLSGTAEEGEITGLLISGARITGVLDLMYARIEHPIVMRVCHFDHAVILHGAQLRQLNLEWSYLPGLDASRIQIDGVLRMTGCVVPSEVRLGGARLSDVFFLNKARLGDEDEDQRAVLHLGHATVDYDIVAADLRVHGGFHLNDTTVSGSVNLTRAALLRPGGPALEARSLDVGSDLQATDIQVSGRVNLRGARISQQLDLTRARLSNPGGTALRTSSAVMGELWLRDATPIEGLVNLRRAQIDMLYATPDVWPDVVSLDELTYATLVPQLPAEQRLPLLEREELGYVPYSYEQLTAAYRRIGDDAAARTVQLAKYRRHRGTLPWYTKLWGYLQDVAVGYGFRPMRAVGWLAALLLIGTVVFGSNEPPPLKADEAPPFNAFFYTFDLLLPIIDFGQERAFRPQGWYQWTSYALILAGWVLATTIAAGITRFVSRV